MGTASQCDRCLEHHKEGPCEYGDDDRKCARCANDKKGCFWGGVSRDGKTPRETTTKKTKETTGTKGKTNEKRETRGAGKTIQRKWFRGCVACSLTWFLGTTSGVSVDVPAIGEAGPSRLKTTVRAKGKGYGKPARRLRSEIEEEIEVVDAERRTARNREKTWRRIADHLDEELEALSRELDEE
jgi:hypothetical protein